MHPGDGYFDERVAARFDERYTHLEDPAVVDPMVDFVADLAVSGTALEFGIGTGRIALPLAKRGIRVHGIEMSQAMVARLRDKPSAQSIGVTIGDFATTTVDATFSVVYLVANTIMNLTAQDQQVACFRTPLHISRQAVASSSRCWYQGCSGFLPARLSNPLT